MPNDHIHKDFITFRKNFYQKCFPETWEKEMQEADERAAEAEQRRRSPVSAAQFDAHNAAPDPDTTASPVILDEERTVPGCFAKLKESLRRFSSGSTVCPGL